MIAHRKHPWSLQRLWLVYIGALLATLLLAGCGNSMASTAKGDPGGIATGGKADVVGQVDGAPVFVDDRGNPTSDLTQAARDADGNPISEIDKAKTSEPLAFALANMIGQNRIGINFVWTLVTGFLVMFMQAGFALVETGFTPSQERRAHHDDELHGLRAGHARLLHGRLRLPVRRHRRTRHAGWRSALASAGK